MRRDSHDNMLSKRVFKSRLYSCMKFCFQKGKVICIVYYTIKTKMKYFVNLVEWEMYDSM